ncbi:molybdenum metabolism regulator, partial [Priestia megaterium]
YDEQDLDLDWDEDDEDGLQMRFPVLWNRYWNNHLEY